MNEGHCIRKRAFFTCVWLFVQSVSALAQESAGEIRKDYTPHFLINNKIEYNCEVYGPHRQGTGSSTGFETIAGSKPCVSGNSASIKEPAADNMPIRRDAKVTGNLFDKSVSFTDRIKNSLTNNYNPPAREEVRKEEIHMDLYDDLYNQKSGGRRSIKWRLRF